MTAFFMANSVHSCPRASSTSGRSVASVAVGSSTAWRTFSTVVVCSVRHLSNACAAQHHPLELLAALIGDKTHHLAGLQNHTLQRRITSVGSRAVGVHVRAKVRGSILSKQIGASDELPNLQNFLILAQQRVGRVEAHAAARYRAQRLAAQRSAALACARHRLVVSGPRT